MRLRFEHLERHLEGPLAPVYVVSGDEPLQLAEAADAIRAAARRQGFGERQVMHVGAGFDWNGLAAACDSLSLFAERRLFDLRLPDSGPGKEGAAALAAYAGAPSADNLLLVTCGKLDKRQQQSVWFKALDGAGAALQVWPVEPGQLPGWIARRMRARGLEPSAGAARLLAAQVEGNLLAAAQEVEKLWLLHGEGAIDEAAVAQAVADSARFDVFELVDAALAGERARTVRVLEGLRGEGVEPVLVLWALAREIRSLAAMARDLKGGKGVDAVMGQHRVWDKRKPVVRAALQRHPPGRWYGLLARAARVDRMIKGVEPGKPWDELLQLALLIAGVRLV